MNTPLRGIRSSYFRPNNADKCGYEEEKSGCVASSCRNYIIAICVRLAHHSATEHLPLLVLLLLLLLFLESCNTNPNIIHK